MKNLSNVIPVNTIEKRRSFSYIVSFRKLISVVLTVLATGSIIFLVFKSYYYLLVALLIISIMIYAVFTIISLLEYLNLDFESTEYEYDLERDWR